MNTMFIYIVQLKKEFRKFENYEKYSFGVYFISLRCPAEYFIETKKIEKQSVKQQLEILFVSIALYINNNFTRMPSEENPPTRAPEVFSLMLRPSPGEIYLAKAYA